MTPRVSVVVPAYENSDYIEATLDSILAQTYTDFEVVVADHSSTDETWRLLQRYAADSRVRLSITPTGGGAEANWNRVTDQARGELVKLVCGDDLIYPDMLERQVAALDSTPGTVMVASPRDIIDARGRTVVANHGLSGLPRGRVVPGRTAIRRSVLRGTNIFGEPCCVLLTRQVLTAIGGWHGNPGYLIDQGTYSRALLHGNLVTTDGPLAAFRLNGAQWSVRLAKEQAASAAQMHRQLAELEPGILSRSDLAVGDTLAGLRAIQRRIVYLYLGQRLQPTPAEKQTPTDS